MKKIYKERLRKFAEHLQEVEYILGEHDFIKTINIVVLDEPMEIRVPIEVQTKYFLFEELVEVFPEDWGWSSKTGDPILEKNEPDGETADSVFEYFGIEDYEVFCHLYCCAGNQQQVERFGGKILTLDSQAQDYAFNILEYIKKNSEKQKA